MNSSIIVASVGLVINRVRGGTATDYLRKANWISEKDSFPFVKVLNDFAFATSFMLGLGFGFDLKTLLAFTALFLAMWAGRSLGWGSYIGGMIERKVSGEKEVAAIDALVLTKKDHPVLRNTIALSLRGMIWTVCLFVGFLICDLIGFQISDLSFLIVPLGLLMGPTYFLAMEICQRIPTLVRGNGWQLGELIWGFTLWGGCGISIF